MPHNEKISAARLSVLSNTILILFKLVVGLMMHSVSVLSEAIHSGIDLVASVIALFAVKESGKPADHEHPFGHGKIENVAGTIEAVLIFGAALFIIWEAVHKLIKGSVQIEHLGVGALVMAVAALANYLVSERLMKVAKQTESVALEADAMHLRTDVYTSVGVFAGLVAIKVTGIALLDPIMAIVVACLILKAAYDLTKSAFFHILDIKLPDEEEAIIHDVMNEYSEHFMGFHKLRTRKSGHIRHIDMHLVVPKLMTVELAHKLSHQISSEIESRLDHSHVLVHIEPCPGECDVCVTACPSQSYGETPP